MEQTDFAEQREDLLQSIEREEGEMRVAAHELAGAVRSKFSVTEHIKHFPLTWALGALLVGVWFGSRGASVNTAPQRRL